MVLNEKMPPPVHKNGCFRGRERKNELVIHEKGRFCGWGPGYLLYLHDVLRFLEMTV